MFGGFDLRGFAADQLRLNNDLKALQIVDKGFNDVDDLLLLLVLPSRAMERLVSFERSAALASGSAVLDLPAVHPDSDDRRSDPA